MIYVYIPEIVYLGLNDILVLRFYNTSSKIMRMIKQQRLSIVFLSYNGKPVVPLMFRGALFPTNVNVCLKHISS